MGAYALIYHMLHDQAVPKMVVMADRMDGEFLPP